MPWGSTTSTRATDITGFGLLGHAREMAAGSEVGIEFDHTKFDFIPGALEYAKQGAFPGGQKNNRNFAECAVQMGKQVPRRSRACSMIRRRPAAC